MSLEKLNLEEVQKTLGPHLRRQDLAKAKDKIQEALMLDIDEAERTRLWTVERLVLINNELCDLTAAIQPYRTFFKIIGWLIASASGIAAIATAIWAIIKKTGAHKP